MKSKALSDARVASLLCMYKYGFLPRLRYNCCGLARQVSELITVIVSAYRVHVVFSTARGVKNV